MEAQRQGGDPRTRRRLERREKARLYRQTEDLRWVLSKPQGRRFLVHLAKTFRLGENIPVGNALVTHTYIGEQGVGNEIRRMIERLDRMLWPKMELEWLQDPQNLEPEQKQAQRDEDADSEDS